MLRARIIGVVMLACLVGAPGAGAQTPTPDPAPLSPPPVVEPTPTPGRTTPEPSVSKQTPKLKPKQNHKERLAPVVQSGHPALAEAVPNFMSSRASAPTTSVVSASASVVATTGSDGSPVVLILVFLLGSASLLIAVLKDVPVERLTAVPIILTEHRGEMIYVASGLLMGIGIGMLATVALQ